MEHRASLPQVHRSVASTQGGAPRASLPWFSLVVAVGVTVLLGFVWVRLGLPGLPAETLNRSAMPAATTARFEANATLGAFEWPVDITADGRGWLYVTDKSARTVTMFAARQQVGVLGFGQRELLQGPMGVAVDREGYLYVADITLRRIAVFDPGGTYRGDFATEVFDGTGRIPSGLAVSDEYLYVTDLGQHQVLMLGGGGELVRVLGLGKGDAPGELSHPNGVWVAQDGVIWISDTNNNRIQRFTADGTPLGVWGSPILSPRDLIVAPDGRVFVASPLAHQVLVLDADGRRLQAIEGSRTAALRAPTGLALVGSRLYITDRLRGAVQEWIER